MSADLHIHTTASDGKSSPADILTQSINAGLSEIAITDHDTVEGLAELRRVYAPLSPRIIPGIEFSTDLPCNEVHILGYFIDIENSELIRQLKIIADDRLIRAEKMVKKLEQLGYPVSFARVVEIAGKAMAIGRPHVAQALLEQGYFSSISEVFDIVLEKNKPAYVPHHKLLPAEVIELINMAGGVPVLAHPGLVGSDQIILDVIKLGIKGLEIYHPKHSHQDISKYEALAAKYKLIPTGGSDYHGISGRFPEKLGDFTIPSEMVYRLEQSRH